MGITNISSFGYGFHLDIKERGGTFWDDLDEMIDETNSEFKIHISHQEDAYDDLPIFIRVGGYENWGLWNQDNYFPTSNPLEITFKISEDDLKGIKTLIQKMKNKGWLEKDEEDDEIIGWYSFNCCR